MGWLQQAAQLRCNGQPLNIFEKYALGLPSSVRRLQKITHGTILHCKLEMFNYTCIMHMYAHYITRT